jgi:hypothetical protein
MHKWPARCEFTALNYHYIETKVKGQTVPVSGEITTGCPPILFAGIFLRHPLENTPSLIEDNHFFCMIKNPVKCSKTPDYWRDGLIAIKIPIAKS